MNKNLPTLCDAVRRLAWDHAAAGGDIWTLDEIVSDARAHTLLFKTQLSRRDLDTLWYEYEAAYNDNL